MLAAILTLVLLLGSAPVLSATEPAARQRFAEARSQAASALDGAWTGRWQATGSSASGAVEVIFAGGAERGAVLAQFTFMAGANTFTSRREGTTSNGDVRFEAPDDGEIVLRMDSPGRLVGDFSGGPTLPARQGSLELTPAR